jgi:potassium/hydrogen antiporter
VSGIDHLVLAGAMLLLLAILASALSYRIGMPLLLVFLAVGMLAGEDGPGGIVFHDAGIAYAVGSVALAVILLDGGLNTRADGFRAGLRPASVLATFGVLLTCVLTGLFAAWILEFGLLEGLLVGAVVGSTDAAAVFALLRAKGLALKQRVSATLEIESGSNDPMAVLLTVVLLDMILSGQRMLGWETLGLLALQLGLGLAAGIGGGRLLAWLVNRLPLEQGMYPMLILAGGLALYGLTTFLGGSGFLAIYLAGVVVGNRHVRQSRQILQVHNGMAWLAQIGMFLILGLLATPSDLIAHAPAALAIAMVLMFVVRPLAVWLCLLPFHFPTRERLFISWVGLRGAVPIILGLFPLLAGLPEASAILAVAFFVTLVSLTVQGWTVAPLARRLRLEVPPMAGPDERFDLDAPLIGNFSLLGYRLTSGARVLGRPANDLHLAASARLVAVMRDDGVGAPARILVPTDAGNLACGDLVYVLAPETASAEVGALLAAPVQATPAHLVERVFYGDFVLRGEARLADVANLYGLPVPDGAEHMTLADYLSGTLRGEPVEGDRSKLGAMELVVRQVDGDRIVRVGLRLPD